MTKTVENDNDDNDVYVVGKCDNNENGDDDSGVILLMSGLSLAKKLEWVFPTQIFKSARP